MVSWMANAGSAWTQGVVRPFQRGIASMYNQVGGSMMGHAAGWAVRNPNMAMGALGVGALGIAAGDNRVYSGAAVGGLAGRGLGIGLAYTGGALSTKLAGRRLGMYGAAAGALIGAGLSSNRGANRIRGLY